MEKKPDALVRRIPRAGYVKVLTGLALKWLLRFVGEKRTEVYGAVPGVVQADPSLVFGAFESTGRRIALVMLG